MAKQFLPPKTVSDFLSYKLSTLSRLINRKSTRYFADNYDLSLAEWRCIAQVFSGDVDTVRDIAEKSYSDKGQVSRAAASLVKKGFLKKVTNKQDGRSDRLVVTAAGRDLYYELFPLRAAENDYVLSTLKAQDQKKLLELIDALFENLVKDEKYSR